MKQRHTKRELELLMDKILERREKMSINMAVRKFNEYNHQYKRYTGKDYLDVLKEQREAKK